MDLFVVPTIGFELLYVLVIVGLERRDLVWINVTANPVAEWIAHQITEAFPWDEAPRYLIRDRDGVYGAAVMCRLRAMGIRDRPIARASPWQNGYAERLIGSIRRECTDHVVAFGAEHLRRVLQSYACYYNMWRTHRSLDKDAPFHRVIERFGVVAARPVGGEFVIFGGKPQQVGQKKPRKKMIAAFHFDNFALECPRTEQEHYPERTGICQRLERYCHSLGQPGRPEILPRWLRGRRGASVVRTVAELCARFEIEHLPKLRTVR